MSLHNFWWHIVALQLLTVLPIHSLSDCFQCQRNYSTLSLEPDVNHAIKKHIPCSISNNTCGSKQAFQPSNVPHKLSHRELVNWYLYNDEDNHTQVALNVSFRFTHDISLERSTGFHLSFTKHSSVNSTHEVFLCLHTKLHFYDHAKAAFFYKCYGTTSSTHIFPEDNITVRVEGLPFFEPLTNMGSNHLEKHFRLPSCSDKLMSTVHDCILWKQLFIEVIDAHCYNSTFSYAYNIPKELGNFATLQLCQGKSLTPSKCVKFIHKWSISGQNATSQFTIPGESYDENISYTLFLWVSSANKWQRHEDSFSYIHCPVERQRYQNSVLIKCLTPVSVIVVIALVVTILCQKFRVDVCELLKRQSPQNHHLVNLNVEHPFENERHPSSTPPISVYIIFVNDHYKHERVVIAFTNYLQYDLGFHVNFELWEANKVAEESTMWRENARKNSDKVIIIWSPGATKRWNGSNPSQGTSDSFTPVVKQIHRFLYNNVHPGKYFFAYFEYCGRHGQPVEDISRHIARSFNLMSQFNELYFQLISQEIYEPGGVSVVQSVQKDMYYDPDINTYGPALKQAIDDMSGCAKENPNWHSLQTRANRLDISATVDGDEIVPQPLNIIPPPDENSITNEMQNLLRPDFSEFGNAYHNEFGAQFLPSSFSFNTEESSAIMFLPATSESVNSSSETICSVPLYSEVGADETDPSFAGRLNVIESLRLPFPERPHPRVQLVDIDYAVDPSDAIDKINRNVEFS